MVTSVIDTLDIKEQLRPQEGLTLVDLAKQVAKSGAIFVEIGSWKGHSASFLGQVAKEYGGHLYCVDHWRGSAGVEEHEKTGNCLDIFRHNMEALGLSEYVHPLVMTSSQAAKIFADGIADLIFLDADHHYQEVKRDIRMWWNKVKIGGVLCGHDAELFYTSLPKEVSIEHIIDKEYIGLKNVADGAYIVKFHPGVVKALYDSFGDTHLIATDTSIWLMERAI